MARNSEIFAQLDPAVVKKLEEKQIRYTRYLIDEKHKPYASWQQSFMTDDRKVRLVTIPDNSFAGTKTIPDRTFAHI